MDGSKIKCAKISVLTIPANSTAQQIKQLFYIRLHFKDSVSVLMLSSLESWGVEIYIDTLFVTIACELARQQHHHWPNLTMIFTVLCIYDQM